MSLEVETFHPAEISPAAPYQSVELRTGSTENDKVGLIDNNTENRVKIDLTATTIGVQEDNNVEEQVEIDFTATTGLRGIAALLIFFGHFWEFFAPIDIRNSPDPRLTWKQLYPYVALPYNVPVVIFFLLSGTLYGYLYHNKLQNVETCCCCGKCTGEFWNFMVKRWARLAPAYYISYALGLYPALHNNHVGAFTKIWAAFWEFTMLQMLFSPPVINGPAWQVSTTFISYFTIPFLSKRINIQNYKAYFYGSCGIAIVFMLALFVGMWFVMYFWYGRWWHFIMGYVIGKVLVWDKRRSPNAPIIVDIISFLWTLWILFGGFSYTIFGESNNMANGIDYTFGQFVLTPVWAAYIFYMVKLEKRGFTYSFLSSTPLQTMGKYSYHFFILHFNVMKWYTYMKHGQYVQPVDMGGDTRTDGLYGLDHYDVVGIFGINLVLAALIANNMDQPFKTWAMKTFSVNVQEEKAV